MQTKIAFISYPVANLDRAVGFYQKVLGKEPLFHREDWAEFDLCGQRLALQKSSSPGGVGATVYFLARPIEGFVLRLKELDAALDGNIEIHSYGKLARFRDPDGNILGLYEPPE
ncbi:MAG: VOC family protein [Nitrospinae bacterium]|nr:VOC family protein [Nitrospinota bacterium]MBL7020038.1 VOC family protein [Nitrospinaceae bacterium]